MVLAGILRPRQPVKAPLPKSLTFRIDEIPIDNTENVLAQNIEFITSQDPILRESAASLVHHSLVPKDKEIACATVSITTALSGRDLCDRLGRAGPKLPYTYTCQFDDITPLYEDKNGAQVDILAIPGLASHPLGSWRSSTSNHVWLRDYLPKDLPNTRVLIYGYDTTLPGSTSKQSLQELGHTLLERICAFRANDGNSHRPLILIGHSLGGLLIKEALVKARRQRSKEHSDFSKACFGLLFFGVPNLGLQNQQLRTLVKGQPNEALVNSLCVDEDSEPSPYLMLLAKLFSQSCKGHYRVVTFYERGLSRTLERSRDGTWTKTGPLSLLVTERSAANTGLVARADEDAVSFNVDHSGLVKYGSRSQGNYPVVRERLRRLVAEAKIEVAKRFAEHRVL